MRILVPPSDNAVAIEPCSAKRDCTWDTLRTQSGERIPRTSIEEPTWLNNVNEDRSALMLPRRISIALPEGPGPDSVNVAKETERSNADHIWRRTDAEGATK